jgi:hypothetical protein
MEVVVGCRSLSIVGKIIQQSRCGRMLMLYCIQVLLNYIRPEIIPYLEIFTIQPHTIL